MLLYSDFVDLDGSVHQDRLPIIESIVSQVQRDGNLDGIALQVVGGTDTFNVELLRTTLETLKKYGLPIFVPEFSIVIGGENTPDNLREQARVGAEAMRVVRECGCVDGVTTFGLEDRITNLAYKIDNANAGFWVKTEAGTYIPKPIVYEVMAVLASDE
jgi:GH35 family endo-1,4-beta-xylanase